MNTLEKLRFENASNGLRNAVEEGEAIPFDGMANAKAYSDLCREWEEVRQLYRLFDWNYWQCKNGLCLGYDGSIAEKITASEFDAISIAVNGYVANLISAGRNLADCMDSVLKGGGDWKRVEIVFQIQKRDSAQIRKRASLLFSV